MDGIRAVGGAMSAGRARVLVVGVGVGELDVVGAGLLDVGGTGLDVVGDGLVEVAGAGLQAAGGGCVAASAFWQGATLV